MPKKLLPTEQQEQIASLAWLKLKYPAAWEVTFSLPNEGKISTSTGFMMKKAGVKAGVPDLFMGVQKIYREETNGKKNTYLIPGLFIEMKSSKGKLSEYQKNMHASLRNKGYAVKTCYSSDEFIEFVTKYLSNDYNWSPPTH